MNFSATDFADYRIACIVESLQLLDTMVSNDPNNKEQLCYQMQQELLKLL